MNLYNLCYISSSYTIFNRESGYEWLYTPSHDIKYYSPLMHHSMNEALKRLGCFLQQHKKKDASE